MPRCAEPAIARGGAALACAGLGLLLASCAGSPPGDAGEKRREADEVLAIEAVEIRALPGEVASIEAALRSPFPAVRARAAEAAGRSPYVKDAAPLALLVSGDAEPWVRREAAVACGRIGGPAAVDVLREASREPDPSVRRAAIAGLGALPGAPFDRWPLWALSEEASLVRREAAFAALRQPDLVAEDSWKEFVRKEEDERVRWAIWLAMARSPGLRKGVDTQVGAGDPNFLVSAFALAIPGVPPGKLIAIAGDPRRFWIERDAALRALAAVLPAGGPGEEDAAIERLLVEIVRSPVGPALPPPLRLRAISVLARARGDEARRLTAELRDRGSTAEVLAVRGGLPAAGEDPSMALSDPSARVRLEALSRLAEREPGRLDASVLGNLLAEPAPSAWPLRVAALRLAARLGREGLPLLERALEDPVPVVSRSAWLHWRRLEGTEPPRAPRAGDLPPYPFASPVLVRRARNPRAEVTIAGKGTITLELFVDEAPHHVASFMDLARSGFYAGRRVERVDASLGVVLCDARFEKGPVAGAPLPDETSAGTILRGTLFSLSASGGPRVDASGVRAPWTAAGSFAIAHVPLPELTGAATAWGRVVLGIEVLDRIVEEDAIERVEVTDRILEAPR